MKNTTLHALRLKYHPQLPDILKNIKKLSIVKAKQKVSPLKELKELFPKTICNQLLNFEINGSHSCDPLKVGVVFSGGQASGGHNVIAGLFDALHALNDKCKLFGFLGGPSGILEKKFIEITNSLLNEFRNQGGFDLIGSGRTKIESDEQFIAAEKAVLELDLDGLVIIGGDDSNTNAALLAEYFLQRGVKTKVAGVPKTIDGDLRGKFLEISFGFDTACKIYSEMIGNIARDALSAKKYYHFIKLMGRSASHIALECALATHPNFTLLGEEVITKKSTLNDIVAEISNLITTRASKGKTYGIILIPEGLIEFIPEIKKLINELNSLLAMGTVHHEKMKSLANNKEKIAHVKSLLSKECLQTFENLPIDIQKQLLLERDPHGNVQVSLIETEKLLMELVAKELKRKKDAGMFTSKFSAISHFFGYEGRAGFPSNFDAQYCYALGHVAALLLKSGVTGYLSSLTSLNKSVEEWLPLGVPLVSMMDLETRHGKLKPVIKKALVDLNSAPFTFFSKNRKEWGEDDLYLFPGPIQFFGDKELTDSLPLTLIIK